MLAEFSRVSVFCVLEQCSVVSVSSLEIVFCKSDDVLVVLLSLHATVAW